MAYYRLYFFRRDGHIAHSYDFEAKNDREAVKFASVWVEEAPMELWRGDQKLKRWEAG